MTCVAWDGKTLAAEKQATSVGYGTKTTKIFRINGALCALAGDGAVARELLEWFRAGAIVKDWPESAVEGTADMLVIGGPAGKCVSYGGRPFPVVIENAFTAMGTGRDYALAAMYLGKSAREAVEVACALDINCGLGIDTLELQ